MPEPLKNLFNRKVIGEMAEHLSGSGTNFDAEVFLSVALDGLDGLELSERSRQIENALHESFSGQYETVVKNLVGSLHPETEADISEMATDGQGIAGWAVMPMAGYIARFGLDQPDFSLTALREMTMRSSSEFAVRPFFRDHTELTLEAAQDWARDRNVHVRRLASEGSRPRLPWGIRLHGFVKDPVPVLSILNLLRDDPSEYVRRSVANNLNDIAKDHPDLVGEIALAWLDGGSNNRKRLVKHACRTLIKDGHSGALAAFGFGPPVLSNAMVSLSHTELNIGETLEIALDLQGGANAQKLLIDYIVHFKRSNGSLSPKVFKWSEITLEATERRTLRKLHHYRKVTTRKDYPGEQMISVRINGQDIEGPKFYLSV